jgi:hypothetical protein
MGKLRSSRFVRCMVTDSAVCYTVTASIERLFPEEGPHAASHNP